MGHTPKPWKTIVRDNGSVYKEKGNIQEGPHVVYNISDTPDRERFEADHKLEDAAPEMRQLINLGYTLSTYAAASEKENTKEFLDGLFDCVEKYQERYEALLEQLESGN